MLGHALRVAQELEVIQSRVSQLTRHLYVLISLKEGDRVRAVFERGGRTVDHVGVVRVMTDVSFFLELMTGSLLLVEDTLFLEILQSSLDVDEEC